MRRREIAFGVVGALLLLSAALLFGWLWREGEGGGWQMRRWSNVHFEGEPEERALRPEPFVRERPGLPFSAEWSAVVRLHADGLYEFTVDADDAVALRVDGKQVFEATGARSRARHIEKVQLAAGLHELSLRHAEYGGSQALRIYFNRMDAPHGWMPLPWPARDTWPTRAAAKEGEAHQMSGRARAALFGAVLLLVAMGLLSLGARRWRLGRDERRAALLCATALALCALARLNGIGSADLHWDENAYLRAGMHYVRSLELGDPSPSAFSWNMEHPPLTKWLYGFAERFGGEEGARLFTVALHLLTAFLLFLLGRRYASLWVGGCAALFFALTPYLVGHGRIVGLESPLLFFFTLTLWLLMRALERNTFWRHLAWGFCAILAVSAKAIALWLAPVALLLFAFWCYREGHSWRRLWPWSGAFLGAALGLLSIYATWPWLWPDLPGQLAQTLGRHLGGSARSEWFLGSYSELPVGYFAFAFLVMNPLPLLLLGLARIPFALKRRTYFDLLLIAGLLFPFGQSLSSIRQDAARYVITAWPALLLLAALSLESVATWLGARLGRGVRPAALGLVPLYLMACVAWSHPHELDYCSEWAGGSGGVARRRWLEIPFWGEGNHALAALLDRKVPEGARVHFKVMPIDDFPAIRADLVRVPLERADYLLMSQYGYPALPEGFALVEEVRVGGRASEALLGALYRRAEKTKGEKER